MWLNIMTTLSVLSPRECHTKCLFIVLYVFVVCSIVASDDVSSTEFTGSTSTENPIDEKPIVLTGLGRIQGSALRSRLGALFYGFRGIPYAKAPVGDLRFKVW